MSHVKLSPAQMQGKYSADFWGVPPEQPHIPGHLQRARHLVHRKNPFHPSAMPLSRVQPGVPFVCYDDFWNVIWARGTFLGFPTTRPLFPGLKYSGLWAKVRLEDGQLALLALVNAGIIKMTGGAYMDRITVSPKHEHLLMAVGHSSDDEIRRRLRLQSLVPLSR